MAQTQETKITDTSYPELLRQIPDPPKLLMAKGNLTRLLDPQLAIVGSRNPTLYGASLAQDFAKTLSEMGFTITSGLALGIDAAAHRGALLGTGRTIAVLGTGLDRIYPKSHQRLADEIIEAGGLILSEFPLGASPLPWHFPKRNRIISGLSYGVLVIEATLGSGSLRTADHALAQGREVFAIPGSVHSPLSRGCHALIQQGAKLVNDVADVLVELQGFSTAVKRHLDVDPPVEPGDDRPPKMGNAPSLGSGDSNLPLQDRDRFPLATHLSSPGSTGGSSLINHVGYDVTPIDTLIEATGYDIGRLSAGLLELELQGYIAGIPGGYIRLAPK